MQLYSKYIHIIQSLFENDSVCFLLKKCQKHKNHEYKSNMRFLVSVKKKIRKSLNTKKKVLKLEMPARKSFCSCKGCLKIKAIANKNSVWQEDKTMENQNSAIHN